MNALFARLGLTRPELRAWGLYDWANSVFMTTVLQVFPIYFAKVAAADLPPATASARFAAATTVSMTIIALLSPVLGAMADYAGIKKKMLAAFMLLGVLATGAMVLIQRGDWLLAAVLLILGNIGVTGSFVFYDSLLPHVAREDEVDRVSAAGFSLGYLAGGLLLAVNMVWMLWPRAFGFSDTSAATRASFLSAAVWWLAFSIPLFRRVSEPARRLEADERVGLNPLRVAFTRLAETLRELRTYRDAFLMLLAFLVYNDGISTIIRMGTIYGTEVGIAPGALLGAVLMIQLVGVPCSVFFGMLAARIGPRRAIFGGLAVYLVITGVGYFMKTAADFFVLSALVGMVMGGTQALSRSLFSTLIPKHKSSEFFGFYGVFDKFAGVLGPALFATMATATGSSRPAILGLVAFFVAGGALLASVDVGRGQRAAREAEARLVALPLE